MVMRANVVVVMTALALAGCAKPKQLYVDGGYVRLPAVAKQPAAAYFTLHGGPSDKVLISVSSPYAIRGELHESMNKGGMSTMAPLQQVDVPAATEVPFKPGGKHVMLFDVNPTIKPGGSLPLIFTFADGVRIQLDAATIAAGAPPPK
jgi:periplasmic copper chaperone A